MILEKEIGLIKDDEVRSGVQRLVGEQEEFIKEYPPSITGRFHEHEPTMEIHLQRVVWFAVEMAREFKIVYDEFDILIASAILHDIGYRDKCQKGQMSGEGWRFYKATGWSRCGNSKLHPVISASMINEKPFKHSPRIAELCSVHMGQWHADSCPMPEKGDLLAYSLCASDYLASRGELIIKKEGT